MSSPTPSTGDHTEDQRRLSAPPFEPATKEDSRARIALVGPWGCGKTYTALKTAEAFGGRIAVLDTERGKAKKFAHEVAFEHAPLHYFDPRLIISAVANATAAGFDTLVVDSFSAFWSDRGGVRDLVDQNTPKYNGSSFSAWAEVKPLERAAMDALLGFPGHVILTMRTKVEYRVEESEDGRMRPRKVGTTPEQRTGVEYEMDVVGEMDFSTSITFSKSMIPTLRYRSVKEPTGDDIARPILDWLSEGALEVRTVRDFAALALDPHISAQQLRELWHDARRRSVLHAVVQDDDSNTVELGDLLTDRGRKVAQIEHAQNGAAAA